MTRRVQVWLIAATFVATLAGCGGRIDVYDKADGNQMLELMPAEEGVPWREFFKGSRQPATGEFVLHQDQQVSKGRFSKSENTYTLSLDGTESTKIKFDVLSDYSLRDEHGGIWQHKTHDVGVRLRKTVWGG